MLTDKAGNKLYRKAKVKVVFPDKIFPDKTFVQHAGARQGFGPDGIDGMLFSVEEQLTALYPFWEFTVTELKPEGRTARFVFTFAGYRSANQPSKI